MSMCNVVGKQTGGVNDLGNVSEMSESGCMKNGINGMPRYISDVTAEVPPGGAVMPPT